jgi:hypothetical protein
MLDISTLHHELIDNSMKRCFCVGQAIVFACAELAKAIHVYCQPRI